MVHVHMDALELTIKDGDKICEKIYGAKHGSGIRLDWHLDKLRVDF